MRLKGGFTILIVLECRGVFEVFKVAPFLWATAISPVGQPGGWKFPKATLPSLMENKVFNLVLDGGHKIETPGGVEALTLGHELEIGNGFFASQWCKTLLYAEDDGTGKVVASGLLEEDGVIAGFF